MKQRFGKYFYLIPVGLFIIALSLIVFRYIPVADSIRGFSIGTGLGLMLVAFYMRYKHSGNNQNTPSR